MQPESKPTQRELLDNLSAAQRQTVAVTLGMDRKASARQIAATFRDDSRLRELLDKLSRRSRDLLATGAFDPNAIALKLTSFDLEWNVFHPEGPRREAAANELERHGLTFFFATHPELTYRVPSNSTGRCAGY